MRNPWLDLPDASPYVLPSDRFDVDDFNAELEVSARCRIPVRDVIPEPFAGAVKSAPVVILQLNPGIDPTKIKLHMERSYRAALLANLRLESSEWPFYFFDPRFRDSQPGGGWWMKRTRRLTEIISLDQLSQRLAVVEWFPYRSPRFRRGCSVASQGYGFFLVSEAIDRGALIIVSRSLDLWEDSVPLLRQY